MALPGHQVAEYKDKIGLLQERQTEVEAKLLALEKVPHTDQAKQIEQLQRNESGFVRKDEWIERVEQLETKLQQGWSLDEVHGKMYSCSMDGFCECVHQRTLFCQVLSDAT